jgi:hypothetical protein
MTIQPEYTFSEYDSNGDPWKDWDDVDDIPEHEDMDDHDEY